MLKVSKLGIFLYLAVQLLLKESVPITFDQFTNDCNIPLINGNVKRLSLLNNFEISTAALLHKKYWTKEKQV